jgi:hypothetical protein
MVIAGCPSGGFLGRYIFVNSGTETIRDFTLSAGDNSKTWASTAPGQGWVTPNLGHLYTTLDVTWRDESGKTNKAQIDFMKAAGYRYKGDLIIEFDETNALRWRLGPEAWQGGGVPIP